MHDLQTIIRRNRLASAEARRRRIDGVSSAHFRGGRMVGGIFVPSAAVRGVKRPSGIRLIGNTVEDTRRR